jgi:hypothetical protein
VPSRGRRETEKLRCAKRGQATTTKEKEGKEAVVTVNLKISILLNMNLDLRKKKVGYLKIQQKARVPKAKHP